MIEELRTHVISTISTPVSKISQTISQLLENELNLSEQTQEQLKIVLKVSSSNE
jgi:hypothetical protein